MARSKAELVEVVQERYARAAKNKQLSLVAQSMSGLAGDSKNFCECLLALETVAQGEDLKIVNLLVTRAKQGKADLEAEMGQALVEVDACISRSAEMKTRATMVEKLL